MDQGRQLVEEGIGEIGTQLGGGGGGREGEGEEGEEEEKRTNLSPVNTRN